MKTTLPGYQIVFVDTLPKKPKLKESLSWVLKLPTEEFPSKDSLGSQAFAHWPQSAQNTQTVPLLELYSLSSKPPLPRLLEMDTLEDLADMVLDESLLPEAELLEDDDDEEAELPEGDGDKEAEEAAAPKLRKPPFFRFNAELKPRAQRVAPGFVSNAHEYSGPLLGEVRCFHGMTLGELANATRVAQHHLQNIEREQYDSLPATVYLRGYLKSVARELGLDMQRVSQSYLERMQQTKS